MTEVEQQIIEQLRCCVCMDVHTKIYQCANGHIVCSECVIRLQKTQIFQKCVVCRINGSLSRNRALEAIALAANVKVSCGIEGCHFMTNVSEISHHRRTCDFQRYQCPIHEYCGTFLQNELYKHLKLISNVASLNENEWLNIRFFQASSTSRQIILFKNKIIVLDIMCFEMTTGQCGPWYDISGFCVNSNVGVSLIGMNNRDDQEHECTVNIGQEHASLFKGNTFNNCCVSENVHDLSFVKSLEPKCNFNNINFSFCDNNLNLLPRSNYVNFVAIKCFDVENSSTA